MDEKAMNLPELSQEAIARAPIYLSITPEWYTDPPYLSRFLDRVDVRRVYAAKFSHLAKVSEIQAAMYSQVAEIVGKG